MFSIITAAFLVIFYTFCTSGNRNEYSIGQLIKFTTSVSARYRVRLNTTWKTAHFIVKRQSMFDISFIVFSKLWTMVITYHDDERMFVIKRHCNCYQRLKSRGQRQGQGLAVRRQGLPSRTPYRSAFYFSFSVILFQFTHLYRTELAFSQFLITRK